MTTETTYKCDICGGHDTRQLLGIYFMAGNDFEIRPYHDAHTHICFNCVKIIKSIDLKKYKEYLSQEIRLAKSTQERAEKELKLLGEER